MRPSFNRIASMMLVALALGAVAAQATPKIKRAFAAKYPETAKSKLDACTTCHTEGAALNAYGLALQKAAADPVKIEKDDADGDGATNLAEIKALTLPGDAKDKPAAKAKPGAKPAKPDSAKPDSAAKPDSGNAPAPKDTTGNK